MIADGTGTIRPLRASGVLVKSMQDGVAQCACRDNASPIALAEARRYLRVSMKLERVAESAEGRIFGGRDGKSRGLVDELGGLSDAIARAKTLAGLEPDARVEVAGDSGGLLDVLTEGAAQGQSQAASTPVVATGVVATLTRFRSVPEVVPFIEAMAQMAAGEHVLCAMPYALEVR